VVFFRCFFLFFFVGFYCQPCFKEGLLADLMAEVQKSVAELLAIAHGGEATGNTAANLAASPESRRAAVRIHLFTLLFEDCSRLCVRLVENTDTMQVREQIDGWDTWLFLCSGEAYLMHFSYRC
jgi:hypothetical protein